jgi:bifunctional DNase/RNase
MPEEYEGSEGPDNLDQPPPFFPYENAARREEVSASDLVEVQIEGVFGLAEANNQLSHFVLVTDGVRKLPIIIGPSEALAIQLMLENSRPDRPMTHDLLKNVLDRLEHSAHRVVIDDFWNGIYYAKLYLRKNGDDTDIEIDSRPSDAIAVAVRFDAPVFVADAILDAAMEE